MKRLILVLSIFMGAVTSFAQGGAKNHEIFTFNNSGDPKPVYQLGMDPEFPFLRNLSSPQQVVSAMQRAERSGNTRQVRELNQLLMAAGFTRGIKDVTVASVSRYEVTPGTTGNMGSGHLNYIYCKMSASRSFQAWKVTADNGDYITFLSPCGNAFYPGSYTAPVSVSALTPVPLPPIEPVTAETTNEYTGEKKCDPCEPKCDPCEVKYTSCGCDDHHHHYYHRRPARSYHDCCRSMY